MNKIAHGVLHGCIGDCCSRRYPSVFTSIDDAEVWNFIYGINESFTQPSKYHSQSFMGRNISVSYKCWPGRCSLLFCQIFVKNMNLSLLLSWRNGILLPKLFWPTVRKNCSSDREKLLKFKAVGREYAKILRSLKQFIQTVTGQNNFC